MIKRTSAEGFSEAYDAIKIETTKNKDAVLERSEELMQVITALHPIDMTTMAALFAMAISGAKMVLGRMGSTHALDSTEPG